MGVGSSRTEKSRGWCQVESCRETLTAAHARRTSDAIPGDPMADSDDAVSAARRAHERRALLTAGVIVSAVGALLLLAGVALGLLEYGSLEQEFLRHAMSSLGKLQVEGVGEVSAAPYPLPGRMSFIIAQPSTWLGLIALPVGIGLVARSFSRDTDDVSAHPEDSPPRATIRPASDEPFDMDE